MKTNHKQDDAFYLLGWIALTVGFFFILWKYFFGEKLSMQPCLIHLLTGFYCPGCGGTRAVRALLRGKIVLSCYYHPLVLYTVAVGGWFMISQTIERISKKRIRIALHYRDMYLWLALILLIVNCLVKNLVLLLTGHAMMA